MINSVRLLRRRLLVCIAGGSLITPVGAGSDLIEALTLTNRIVMLRFDDGTVTYHGPGEPMTDDSLMSTPLAMAALSPQAFTVASTEDDDFAGGVAPLRLGRKSKGVEFANDNAGWVNGFGFKPGRPYAAMDHWLYLELPAALKSGRTYTVAWSGLTLNTPSSSAVVHFDESTARSEAIHVNLLGYVPTAPQKFGYLYHWAGDLGGIDLGAWEGKPFHLVRMVDAAVAYSGTVAFRRPAQNEETGQPNDTPGRNFLGAAVWECDFSAFTTPGEYRLSVPGIGCSFPFRIDRDVYREAFHATMHGLFQSRSGLAISLQHAAEPRPVPHNPRPVEEGGTPGFQNRLFYSSTRFCDVRTDGGGETNRAAIEAGAKGNLTRTWGWYQDAGDWDGYFSHLLIPNGLLLLFQLHPARFRDGELNIPESGNGLPDLVDEGAWLPRFLARQRAELMERGWGTGGVGSRVFGDYWGEDRPGGRGRGSWQDTDRNWFVTGEDPFSTFRYASSAAQLAEVLRDLGIPDPEGVDWAEEAVAAYAWAVANTRPGDETKDQNGPFRTHRALAATALYRLTGDQAFHASLQTDLAEITPTTRNLGDASLMAVVLYLSMPPTRARDEAFAARLMAALRTSALAVTVESADRRACRWGGDFYFPMLVGQPTTPLILPAVLGHRLLIPHDPAAASEVLRVAYTTADYFLGCNPLNTTWITGLGPRHPTGVFCMDDFYSGPAVRRGMTPYGPWRFPESWVPLRMAVSAWWAWDTTYPAIDSRGPSQPAAGAAAPGTWPGHEAWFDNRNVPQTGEFTIWQNNLPNALTYGFLSADWFAPPRITIQPMDSAVEEGKSVALEVSASGDGELRYQWFHNATAVAGATTPMLQFPAVQPYHAGTYTVAVSNEAGTVESISATIVIVPTPPSTATKAVNISTRALSNGGDDKLIPGFVLQGEGTRRVLVRAIGPRLADFGLAEFLADPTLEIKRLDDGESMGQSDDWSTESDAALIEEAGVSVGAFPLDGSPSGGTRDGKSAALVLELTAGVYTALCGSANGGKGVALVEIYDSGGSAGCRMVNLSNRSRVGTGAEVMIPGFVVEGPGPRGYLIRAAGPALAEFGLDAVLADPEIIVIKEGEPSGTVAHNDDWQGPPNNPAAMAAAFAQVGAFTFAEGSKDAALALTLPPGVFTIICRGVAGITGLALVEIYELPDAG